MHVDDANKVLPEALKNKFKCKGNDQGHVPGTLYKKGAFGMIDLKNLTEERANELVEKKFPYLERVTPKDAKSEKDGK